MGLILKKEVDKDCFLGLWEMTEDLDSLKPQVKLNEQDLIRFNSYSNSGRKLEFLSSRLLLKELLEIEPEIVYGPDGKPNLKDQSCNISISHSRKLVAVITGIKREVGIDVEIITDRIEKIVDRFLSKEEQNSIAGGEMRLPHLFLCWSAKETLYKVFNEQKLDFIDNINILPFEPTFEGNFFAIVSLGDDRKKCSLNYRIIKNNSLIWCII